jgi:hypothetical protein
MEKTSFYQPSLTTHHQQQQFFSLGAMAQGGTAVFHYRRNSAVDVTDFPGLSPGDDT